MVRLAIVGMLVLLGAEPALSQPVSVVLSSPAPPAAGDTAAVAYVVSTGQYQIGQMQLAVNYNSTIARFESAEMGPALPTPPWSIWNVFENPVWPPVVPGCDRVVVVQVYGGPFASFTGQNKHVATLNWIIEPGTCGISPIAFDPNCDHSQIVAEPGVGLCPPEVTEINGSVKQFCSGGGGGCSPDCELEKPDGEAIPWTLVKRVYQ